MTAVSTENPWPHTPLDLLEELVDANPWPFDRTRDTEMMVQFCGQWCDYQLFFSWVEDMSAMHFTCVTDMRVPDRKRAPIHELLAVINAKVWLGHFDLSGQGGVPVFRHTVLLRGARGASVEQLEDLVDIALTECERFYPAFQFVVWGGKSPPDAIEAALFETVGEA